MKRGRRRGKEEKDGMRRRKSREERRGE